MPKSYWPIRLIGSEVPLRHEAQSFTALPGPGQASLLLAEIATAPCAFAPAATDAPLALYGAGSMGRLARDFLNAVGHKFDTIIDRNARQLAQDAEWSGMSLVAPDEVPDDAKRGARIAVSIVTSPYEPLERSLSALGFEDIVPFYDLAESFRHRHPLSNGWFAPPLTAQDQERTAKVLALWDDDVSRAHHLQFLAWRRLREEWTFAPAPLDTGNRFFIPEVVGSLRNDEVLLDAGAHEGSVIDTFVRRLSGEFRQIVAVEPDPANRTQLEDRLRRLLPDDRRVTIYDCALAEGEGEALFHDGLGYASQLSQTGRMRVKTRPIDALGMAPTFVKLHLEGGELTALKGGRQTLIANRPLIAATVYHNDDGIWKTAHWLMETLADYRFLFRLHSWCGTGAVVYAIPNKRRAQ